MRYRHTNGFLVGLILEGDSGCAEFVNTIADGRSLQLATSYDEDGSVILWREPPLDIEAAKKILNYKGHIALYCDITDESALILSNFEGNIDLDYSLKSFPDTDGYRAFARKLARQDYQIYLGCLEEIPAGIAEILSESHQEGLGLGGLSKLSVATAKALAKHVNSALESGLGIGYCGRPIDAEPGAAESLSKYKGSCLGLFGLTELSDAAAESLSKYQGDLHLHDLETLSARGAGFLLSAKGDVSTKLDLEAIANGGDGDEEELED